MVAEGGGRAAVGGVLMASSVSQRNRFRQIVNRARAIPGERGLRVHTLERVVKFAGDSAREDLFDKVTPIVEANGQPPKLRQITSEEATVGNLNPGTWIAGPITPEFPGGGIKLALLRGDDLTPNDKLYFRITGPEHPHGALYRRSKLSLDAALHVTLQLIPVEEDTSTNF